MNGHYDGKGLNEIENKNTASYEYIVKHIAQRANWKRKKWAGGIRRRQQIQWLRGSERERELGSVRVYVLLTQAHSNMSSYVSILTARHAAWFVMPRHTHGTRALLRVAVYHDFHNETFMLHQQNRWISAQFKWMKGVFKPRLYFTARLQNSLVLRRVLFYLGFKMFWIVQRHRCWKLSRFKIS